MTPLSVADVRRLIVSEIEWHENHPTTAPSEEFGKGFIGGPKQARDTLDRALVGTLGFGAPK